MGMLLCVRPICVLDWEQNSDGCFPEHLKRDGQKDTRLLILIVDYPSHLCKIEVQYN